jgi:hypothetical protein
LSASFVADLSVSGIFAPQNLKGFLFSLYSAALGHFATKKSEIIAFYELRMNTGAHGQKKGAA